MNMDLMNTFTNDQLIMCEKENLIMYIIEMRKERRDSEANSEVNSEANSESTKVKRLDLFIEERCTTSSEIQLSNGMFLAPTCFEDLYFEFKMWCLDYSYSSLPLDKNRIKKQLLQWQKHSEYGLSLGKTMKEGRKNGSERKPYFNLVVISED